MAWLAHSIPGRPDLFVMLNAYLDESGIHDGATVCVICGYFGGRGQMDKLDKAWRRTLKENHCALEDFHAKNMVGRPKYEALIRSLTHTIADQRKIRPLTFGVFIEDFNALSLAQRRFFTGATLNEKTGKFISSGCPSKPYFVPFYQAIRLVTDATNVGGKANFFVGVDRQQFSGYAEAAFRQIKMAVVEGQEPPAWQTWRTRDRLGNIGIPLAKETPQLQAADLLSYLSYLHIQEIERQRDNTILPGPDLSRCLANTRVHEDHRYIDKDWFADVLSQSRQLLGKEWDAED